MKTTSKKRVPNKKLRDPEQAAEYLTACYQEGPEIFLAGLREVVKAQGSVTRAARLSKMGRASLYRFFSHERTPSLSSLDCLLAVLGLKITFAAL